MAFYRYSATYPEGNQEYSIRSTVPLSLENEKSVFYTHRYYTSELDDAPSYFVAALGHEKSYPGKAYGPRFVDRFIIHYVLSGKTYFNGEPVVGGQFFFTHPYDSHTIRADENDPPEFYYISISGPGKEKLLRRVGFFSIPHIHPFRFQDAIIPEFYDALYRTHPRHDTELYLLGLLHRLLALHQYENTQTEFENSKIGSYLYYRNALSFIQNFLLDGITPKDVANHLHISPSYLREIFARFCKYSLRELMIRKRMECAANKLTFENYTVRQAAALTGYSDYTLFSKLFKKYTGVSPRTYKKENRQIPLLPNDGFSVLTAEQPEQPSDQ